jgi:hypothetical protein
MLKVVHEEPDDAAGTTTAPHLVALVRAGATFESGKLIERSDVRAVTPVEPAA